MENFHQQEDTLHRLLTSNAGCTTYDVVCDVDSRPKAAGLAIGPKEM